MARNINSERKHMNKEADTRGPNSLGAHASPLHKLLGVTPEQVRQEMIDEGVDPDAEIAAMRRLGRVLAAKYAPQIAHERAATERRAAKAYPMFEEAVAAGHPEWIGADSQSRQASFLDIIDRGDPENLMWARVSGLSMRDEGIMDGDVVLVDLKAEPKDGDVIVAHVEGQGQVVKRLRLTGINTAWLESANPDYHPIFVDDASTLTIHGVVIGRGGKV